MSHGSPLRLLGLVIGDLLDGDLGLGKRTGVDLAGWGGGRTGFCPLFPPFSFFPLRRFLNRFELCLP